MKRHLVVILLVLSTSCFSQKEAGDLLAGVHDLALFNYGSIKLELATNYKDVRFTEIRLANNGYVVKVQEESFTINLTFRGHEAAFIGVTFARNKLGDAMKEMYYVMLDAIYDKTARGEWLYKYKGVIVSTIYIESLNAFIIKEY